MSDFTSPELLGIDEPVAPPKYIHIIQVVFTGCFPLMPEVSPSTPSAAKDHNQSEKDQHGWPEQGTPVIRKIKEMELGQEKE